MPRVAGLPGESIAWRFWVPKNGTPGPWSKTHTLQTSTTTRCGVRVPDEVFDADDVGNGDRCKRCKNAKPQEDA